MNLRTLLRQQIASRDPHKTGIALRPGPRGLLVRDDTTGAIHSIAGSARPGQRIAYRGGQQIALLADLQTRTVTV